MQSRGSCTVNLSPCEKQLLLSFTTNGNIGVGTNSILGGPNVIYTAIAVICAACMNINKVSRIKYWGGGAGPLAPLVPTPMGKDSTQYSLALFYTQLR